MGTSTVPIVSAYCRSVFVNWPLIGGLSRQAQQDLMSWSVLRQVPKRNSKPALGLLSRSDRPCYHPCYSQPLTLTLYLDC